SIRCSFQGAGKRGSRRTEPVETLRTRDSWRTPTPSWERNNFGLQEPCISSKQRDSFDDTRRRDDFIGWIRTKVELRAFPSNFETDWNDYHMSQKVSEFLAVEIHLEPLELNYIPKFPENARGYCKPFVRH